MSLISITSMILDKIKFNHNADTRQNINNYKNYHKIGNKGLLKHYKKNINFKYLEGGGKNTYEIELDNNLKYEFYMDEIIPETNTLRRMCFMSNSLSYDCLCVLFGTKQSGDTTMKIEGLLSSNECVKCEDSLENIKIKPADILMQILLKIIKTNPKFTHIKKLELYDTSKKSCYEIGIELLYLRTITNGVPYYAKFGFRPDNEGDYKVFKHNINNYKLNKTLNNDKLIKIIENTKQNMNKNTFEIYKKYIEKYILSHENINPKLFFTEIIDIVDISLGKKEMINVNIFTGNKIIKNKNIMESLCDFLNCICKNVYLELDYKDYHSKMWILYL